MSTALRSRISPDELLRKLLLRAYGVLQDVAIEASEASEPDAIAEALMRDISAALDKRPTLI